MGGGQKSFDTNKQREQVSKDLDKINFFVHFPNENNLALFDLDDLHEKVSKSARNFLKKNGVRFIDLGQTGLGGGGEELTFWDFIKMFWDHKDFLKIAPFMVGSALKIFKQALIRDAGRLKPRINISFFIETDCHVYRIDQEELQSIVVNRLANLLSLSSQLKEYLQNDFGAFSFDLSIEARINSKQYTVIFYLQHELINGFNTSRIMRIIGDLKLRNFFHSDYYLTNWHAIKRHDRFDIESGTKISPTYYLFLSTRIINDYFYKEKLPKN